MSKFLGQHFLKNKAAIERIVSAVAVQPGETIIEIGPGSGALTKPLAAVCTQKNACLIAIEKDRGLASSFKLLAVSNKNFEILDGDILDILPELVESYKLKANSYKLIGNIPYYITGALLRTIGELTVKPIKTVLMVQKEVAQRVCSAPPHMNLLAAATQFWAKPTLLFSLKPSDFDPPPEVESAVIEMSPVEQLRFATVEQLNSSKTAQLLNSSTESESAAYYRLIRIAFKQPRKLLMNNLLEGFPEQKRSQIASTLAQMGLPENIRAQDLSIALLQKLSDALPTGRQAL